MGNSRIIWGIVAIAGGLLSPVVGIVIGLVRYKQKGEAIRQNVREDYERAQAKGGVHSLYYKNTGKRVFQLTFGMPILITFIIGLALMGIAFYNL